MIRLITFLAIFALAATVGAAGLTVRGGLVQSPNPGNAPRTFVECYFSILNHEFASRTAEGDSLVETGGRVFCQFDILDSTGYPIDSTRTYFVIRGASVDPTEDSVASVILNRLALYVTPGTYSARLTVIDVVGKHRGEVFFPSFNVKTPSQGLSLGALTPLAAIELLRDNDTTTESPLVKNGFRLTPNPMARFSTYEPGFQIYGEVYRGMAVKFSSPAVLGYAIVESASGRILSSFAGDTLPAADAVAFGEVIPFPPGVEGKLLLKVIVQTLDSVHADTAVLPFTVAEPVVPRAISSLTGSHATPVDTSLTLDNVPVDDQLRVMYYLLTPAERAAVALLSPAGKRQYIQEYWRSSPTVASREDIPAFKRELLSSYQTTNKLFSTDIGRTNGYLSDRGRIFMTYGAVDEIDDYPSPKERSPFQVWHYRRLRGGVLFVFEERSLSGNYRLVHSNMPGEPYDADWQNALDQDLFETDVDY